MRNQQVAAMRRIRHQLEMVDQTFELSPPMSQMVPTQPVRARRVRRIRNNGNYRVRNLHWQESSWVDTALSVILVLTGAVVAILAWVTLP